MSMLEHYYTPAEAGAVLHLSRREMYRRLARGDMPFTQIPGGKRILIAASDLAALLAAGRVEARS